MYLGIMQVGMVAMDNHQLAKATRAKGREHRRAKAKAGYHSRQPTLAPVAGNTVMSKKTVASITMGVEFVVRLPGITMQSAGTKAIH